MTSTSHPSSSGRLASVSSRVTAPIAASAAIAAPLLFGASVIGFAALRRDGYSHATKAVSELGVLGAPHGALFNAFGFVLTGLLITLAASLFAVSRRRAGASVKGMGSLALAGLAFAAAGAFPFDMANPSAPTSQAHFAAAMLAGLFWAAAAFRARATLAAAGMPGLARLGAWLTLALAINVGWQIAFQAGLPVMPGWGQRIGFAGMMVWVLWFGIALRRR